MGFFKQAFSGFSLNCFLFGLLFFAVSLTPSLIPRDPLLQGVLGGVVTAVGYAVARIALLIWEAAEMPRPGPRGLRILRFCFTVTAVPLFGWTLWSSLRWQNDLREKMEMELTDALHLPQIVIAGAVVATVAFFLGAFVSLLFRVVRQQFYRWMPPRRANVLGLLTVATVLFVATRDGVFDRLITGLDNSYEAAQLLFDEAPPAPQEARKTGSAASLIAWDAIGTPGRDFIQDGPDAAAITRFSGAPALDPIRVYVGRANGETPEERAKLALDELIRVGAFERSVLVVASPTGTGWLDPGAHDPLEYMHGGDIATVAAQYSYLQSPLALIFETNSGLDQATALLEIVHRYWKTLPESERPRLYVHGLSLGAWSSMYATNLFRLVDEPISGAFWAGPPFPSAFWRYVQNARNPGTPWVLPEVGDGSLVRYASHYADASETDAPWGSMRIVFLQYSSDAIVLYDPWSVLRPPPWMNDPLAPDTSAYMRFIPFVTQFQLALDLALSFNVPAGHGHAYYAQDYIAPWVEVSAPEGWTDDDTERLKAHCDLGIQKGCRN